MIADIIAFIILSLIEGIVWYKFILKEATHDYEAIVNDGSKNSLQDAFHRKGATRRFLWACFFSLFFIYFAWYVALANLLLLLAIFFYLFDGFLNKKRNLAEDYVGQTAKIDKWFRQKYGEQAGVKMRIYKRVIVLVSFLLYIVFFFVYLM